MKLLQKLIVLEKHLHIQLESGFDKIKLSDFLHETNSSKNLPFLSIIVFA